MATRADYIADARHDRALTTPPSRGLSAAARDLIRKRYIEAGIVSAIVLAVSIVTIALLGPLTLPMFLVPLPFALVLLWESANELRSDELREASATSRL